ncbi:hypothetical protein ACIBMZ_02615 [Micromonospora sp. NPDC049900]|uniref:hypothetical protein n=1 Tax=Micromonospora sp. NPDC049900 TaxID=3364275 RepID=UPI0037938ED0
MAQSRRPYAVPNSAAGRPSSIAAWSTPAVTSQATASVAHLDQAGRMRARTRSWVPRSRNTVRVSSPPSQTTTPTTCTVVSTMLTGGTGAATGCPASGQVTAPPTPTAASAPVRARPAVPRVTAGSSAAATPTSARRAASTSPMSVSATARRSAGESRPTGAPTTWAACPTQVPTVATATRPSPTSAVTVAPRRDRRGGQRTAASSGGPTASSSPR